MGDDPDSPAVYSDFEGEMSWRHRVDPMHPVFLSFVGLYDWRQYICITHFAGSTQNVARRGLVFYLGLIYLKLLAITGDVCAIAASY